MKMGKPAPIKLYAEASVEGKMPTSEEALALLARADKEIELRVRTTFDTRDSLERYARDFADATGRTLISIRQSDWYKPYVSPRNPYPPLSRKWMVRAEESLRRRAENPRITIIDSIIEAAIEAADAQRLSKRVGQPLQKSGSGAPPRSGREREISLESILWIAREIEGVSEISWLPIQPCDEHCVPITATYATADGAEDISRSINILGVGYKPVHKVLEQITLDSAAARGIVDNVVIWRHRDQRIKRYALPWAQICAIRGYGEDAKPSRACQCREVYPPEPSSAGEAAVQVIQAIKNPDRHKPVCYERFIDLMTYLSDWELATNHFAAEVGERHEVIPFYSKLLAKARRDGEA